MFPETSVVVGDGRTRRIRGVIMAVVAAVLCCAATDPVRSAGWAVYPGVGLEAGVTANAGLREDGGRIATRQTGQAELSVLRLSPERTLGLRGTIGHTLHQNDPDAPEGGGYQSVSVGMEHRHPRTRWFMTANALRDNARVRVPNPDAVIDPGDDVDALTAAESVRRERAAARLSMTHSVSPRLEVNAGYAGTYRGFADAPLDREASWNHEADLGVDYGLRERTSVGVGLRGALFRPRRGGGDDGRSGVNTLGVLLDLEHELTELATVRVSVGPRWSVPVHDGAEADRVMGYAGRLEGIIRGRLWRASALVERRLRPDRRGELRETDQLILRATRSLSPRLESTLRARAFRTRDMDPDMGESRQEDYASLLAGLSYRMSRDWTVTGEYEFRIVERAGADGHAYGNAVFLRLDYVPGSGQDDDARAPWLPE